MVVKERKGTRQLGLLVDHLGTNKTVIAFALHSTINDTRIQTHTFYIAKQNRVKCHANCLAKGTDTICPAKHQC